jgi:hypothetical protein
MSVAGLFHPDSGADRHTRDRALSTAAGISCRRTSGAWAMCFRRRGCSRISVRQNLLYGRRFAPETSGASRPEGVRPDRRPAGHRPSCSTGVRGTCRAARRSASPSAGRSCRGPRCCWRMSRWPPSMPSERKKSCRISRVAGRSSGADPLCEPRRERGRAACHHGRRAGGGARSAQRPRSRGAGRSGRRPAGPKGRRCASWRRGWCATTRMA